VSLLMAIGVNGEGYREVLGICERAKEGKAVWSGGFLDTSRNAACAVCG
jgi:transposase-like protein